MPVKISKAGSGYKVSTPSGTKAKHTTMAKAKAQERLKEQEERRKQAEKAEGDDAEENMPMGMDID